MGTLIFLLTGFVAFAGEYNEPAFCNPKNFAALEIPAKVAGVKELHVYHIGALKLAGLAIGNSKIIGVKNLATQHSIVGDKEKFCTWYFNEGNEQAEKDFHHRYVSRPSSDPKKAAKHYAQELETIFDLDPVSMVSCAEQIKYIAMGCNGMKHRGPSVFAMFLSFAGCKPENSVQIVNKVWGTNGVSTQSRIAIAQQGYEMGNVRPESRERLLKIMTEELK